MTDSADYSTTRSFGPKSQRCATHCEPEGPHALASGVFGNLTLVRRSDLRLILGTIALTIGSHWGEETGSERKATTGYSRGETVMFRQTVCQRTIETQTSTFGEK